MPGTIIGLAGSKLSLGVWRTANIQPILDDNLDKKFGPFSYGVGTYYSSSLAVRPVGFAGSGKGARQWDSQAQEPGIKSRIPHLGVELQAAKVQWQLLKLEVYSGLKLLVLTFIAHLCTIDV